MLACRMLDVAGWWPMTTEVERKWLLDGIPPDIPLGKGAAMRQGYVALDEPVEVRVRISAGEATLTVKAGRGLTRIEVELAVDVEAAEALWQHTAGRGIEKTRHRVPVSGAVAEVDVYGGTLAGLAIVEVEFPSEAEAGEFEAPSWFGREVTGDDRWSNAALSVHGMPS